MPQNNIVKMESFKKKRKDFLKRVDQKGEVELIGIQRENASKLERRVERYEPKETKQYKAKSSERKKSTEEKRRETRIKLWKKVKKTTAIAVLTLSTGIAGGSIIGSKLYHKVENNRNVVTLEQALKGGKTSEDLSIKESYLKLLQEMEQTIENENMTYEELLEVAEELPGLKQIILKEKIAKAFRTPEYDENDWKMNPSGKGISKQVQEEDINFKADVDKKGICIDIQGKGTYRNEKVSDYQTFSSDIQEYIDEVKEAQRMRVDMERRDVSIEDAKEFYKKAIKKINQQATWKIQMDEEGNLEVGKMRQSELQIDDGWEH